MSVSITVTYTRTCNYITCAFLNDIGRLEDSMLICLVGFCKSGITPDRGAEKLNFNNNRRSVMRCS